jgi:hypothetical protein
MHLSESRLRLPGRPGPQTAVDLDQGATETLHAQAAIGDSVEELQRDTYVVDVVPGRRLAFVYRVVVNDQPRWASLTTVQLDTHPGHDHEPDLTRLLLTALAVTLGATPRPPTER